MTSITVFRELEAYAVLSKFKILLDGDIVGKLKIGETIEIPVEPGIHELYVKIDWGRSKKITCTVVDGEKQQFRCCNRTNWYNIFQMLYYDFFKFNDSLLLEKVDDIQEA